MRSSPVIIIGAHRSGTTATARALELLGLEIGRRLDSHRESKPLQQLHDCLLHCYDASWHHPQKFCEAMEKKDAVENCAAEFCLAYERKFSGIFGYPGLAGWWRIRQINRGQPWGWKEPRTTLFARPWLRILPDARIVHVLRHPVAVARSIRQRELRFRAAGDPSIEGLDRLDYCLNLALIYARQGSNARRETVNFFDLRFEDLQKNPVEILRQLTAFCRLETGDHLLHRTAATIHPTTAPWEGLSADEVASLRPMSDELRRLGYETPA